MGRYNLFVAKTSHLDRLLEPLTKVFTPKMASALMELRVDSELEAHISDLRLKANEGTMTLAEEAKYKDFVEAVDVISILQSKARRFLAKQSTWRGPRLAEICSNAHRQRVGILPDAAACDTALNGR